MKDFRVPRIELPTDSSNPVFAYIQAVLEKISETDLATEYSKERLDLLAELTTGQKAVFSITRLETEVNSGGFDSYFRYTGGDSAPEALAGLRIVGAMKFANVLEKAISLFPGGNPDRDTAKRSEQVDSIQDANPEAFEKLDSEFFNAYDGEESLGKLMIAYIKNNPNDFFLP